MTLTMIFGVVLSGSVWIRHVFPPTYLSIPRAQVHIKETRSATWWGPTM